MKTNQPSVMELIKVKAAASANPQAFVPALDSNSGFFFSATSRTRPWTLSGPVAAKLPIQGVVTVPVMAVKVLNGKARLLVKTFGLN